VIVLIVGGYFYQQIQQREALQNVQISLGVIDLKSLGLTSATLGLSLNMYNPNNSVTAILDRTEYQLYANGNELANGEIPNRYDIPPTSTITVPMDVTVSYLDSLRAVFSAFNNGQINWEMKGMAYFEMPILGAIPIPYDFTKTTQFSGNSNQGSNSYQASNSYQGSQTNPSNSNQQYSSNSIQNTAPASNNNIPQDSTTIYPNIISVVSHGNQYRIGYDVNGGTVSGLNLNYASISLYFSLNSYSDGLLTVKLPRTLIDAKTSSGQDEPFFMLEDGMEVKPQNELDDINIRTLEIPFLQGTKVIEIIGTQLGQ